MERIAVFVDEAHHARQRLQSLAPSHAEVHWVVVAFAPLPTRYLGRLASHSARERWCRRWADALRAELDPILTAGAGHRVEHLLAGGSAAELRAQLEGRLPGIRVVDARRPRPGQVDDAPSHAPPSTGMSGSFGTVLLTTGLGMMLVLAD